MGGADTHCSLMSEEKKAIAPLPSPCPPLQAKKIKKN
jgi:hypothetical protein